MSEPSAHTPRRRFWLIASLSLNFFLLGVIVTGLLVARNRMVAAAAGGGGGLPPDVVLQMLPQSGALKMCDALSARTETFRRLGRDAVEARRTMFRSFRAEPFDAQAFNASLGRLTEAQIALLRAREATVADVVARLTTEERAHFSRQVMSRFFSGAPREQRAPGALRAICRSLGASGDLP